MIKIAFTGDIMLARRVGIFLNDNPEARVLSYDVSQILEQHNFVVGNLECPISIKSKKISFNSFKAHPKSLSQIKLFNFLSLANNHIFDCGKSGSLETMDHLLRNDFKYAGLLSQENEKYYSTIEIENKSFSFFSCTTSDCIKDDDKTKFPKVVQAEDNKILDQISELKSSSDYIIVLIHGGDEMIPIPNPKYRELCESYIDNGAHVVISNHPHVLGGLHVYKNKHIFYSLGDFIFDGESYMRRRGAILSLSFIENNVSYSLYPTTIKENLIVKVSNQDIKLYTKLNFKKYSNLLQKQKIDKSTFKKFYIKHLFLFQIDRMFYIIKNKGIKVLIIFILKKTVLIPHYFKKLLR